MAQEGVKNLALDLEYHASVLVGHWVVAAATAAGATQFTVRERWAQAVVPYVGANDAANFTDARLVFRSGANQGFSTVVASVASTVSGGTVTTTVTVKDALPNALAAGDGFTIYRALAIAVTAPENIQEVGAKALPTDTSGNPYLPVESALDVVPLQAIANQAANTSFASFTAPFAGRALLLISLATSSVVNLVVTPVGGTATNLGAINNGTALNANQPYTFEWPVSKGATYALQVATAQSGTLTVSIEVMLA